MIGDGLRIGERSTIWQELIKAAKVIVLTKGTREYLEEHDPKALEQLDAAISDSDSDYKETLKNWLKFLDEEEQEEIFAECVDDLRRWHSHGDHRDEAQTREYLEGRGLKEPRVSSILTGFGY